jgi:hypothetical protein
MNATFKQRYTEEAFFTLADAESHLRSLDWIPGHAGMWVHKLTRNTREIRKVESLFKIVETYTPFLRN